MTHHGFLATLLALAVLPVLCETAALAQIEAEDPPVRTWTDSTGEHTLDAKFLDSADGVVRLERVDGRTSRIPLERLSAEDQWYIVILTAEPEPTEPKPSKPDAEQDFTNSIGIKLRLIPAGEFMMGSPEDEEHSHHCLYEGYHPPYRLRDETQHGVRITKPYYLGVTEVTQGQWQEVMDTRPWEGEGERFAKSDRQYAVSHVSWEDAVEFCRKLSKKEGREYRLPTEAQWEYACRAGTTTRFSFGDNAADLDSYAWYDENLYDRDGGHVHAVGLKRANAWGLYDMHGNVGEWCSDWNNFDYFDLYWSFPTDDPTGPSTGEARVVRGGSWGVFNTYCFRCAYRGGGSAPDRRSGGVGFRVALDPAE